MAAVICASCGRRCDPNRSFCSNCGSAVFVDERDAAAVLRSAMSRLPSTSTASLQAKAQAIQRLATSERTSVADAARALRVRRMSARPAVAAVSLVPFVRLVVVVVLVWYAASWLLRIAEVQTLKQAFQRGRVSDDLVNAAAQAVRDRIGAAIGKTPPRDVAPATPRRPAARAADGPVSPPLEGAVPPPGVSRPGDDVTLPRVVRYVPPAYDPAALRGKPAVVVLEAVVRTNGIASDIETVSSRDAPPGVNQSAVAAVRQWRFVPGQRQGQPVPVLVRIEVRFPPN